MEDGCTIIVHRESRSVVYLVWHVVNVFRSFLCLDTLHRCKYGDVLLQSLDVFAVCCKVCKCLKINKTQTKEVQPMTAGSQLISTGRKHTVKRIGKISVR